MSAGYWSLNGTDLVDVGVKVVPTRLTAEQRIRQVQVAIHDDEDIREMVGADLPTVVVEMQFHGRGEDKFDVLSFVQGVLESDEVFTLAAPALKPAFVFKNFKRAALSCENWNFDAKKATGSIALTFTSIVNGIWIADGGTYCEGVYGTFTKATATTIRNDFTGVVDFLPLLTLPTQTVGYPRAVNTSYSYGVPALYSSTATTQTFDMTGFLIPAPVAIGAVGVYELCSSPAIPGTASPAPGGVGGNILIPVQVQVVRGVVLGTLILTSPNVSVSPLVGTAGRSIAETVTASPTVDTTGGPSSNSVGAVGTVVDQSAAPSASYNVTVVGSVTP